MGCPFDLRNNRGVLDEKGLRKNLFMRSFRREYGIDDPHRYFSEYRKRILDRAEKDPFGVTKYETLNEWIAAQDIAFRFGLLTANADLGVK